MRKAKPPVALALLLGLALGLGDERSGHPCVKGNELWFPASADGVRLVGHRFPRDAARRQAGGRAHMSNGDLCEWLLLA